MQKQLMTLALTLGLTACTPPAGMVSMLDVAFSDQTGGLAIQMELPARRGIQALPENTNSVTITVRSGKLQSPVTKSITAAQFVNGVARMQIDKLPPGDIQVDAVIYDDQQRPITLGGATATIQVGLVTQVALNMVVKGATGGAAISIDTTTVYDDPVVTVPAMPIATQSLTLSTVRATYYSPTWTKVLHLEKGQSLNLTSTGRVGYGSSSNYLYNYYEPDGTGSFPSGLLFAGASALSLVGKFQPDDSSEATSMFKAGKSMPFTAPSAGTLYLGVNTWVGSTTYYFGGSYSVTLTPAL